MVQRLLSAGLVKLQTRNQYEPQVSPKKCILPFKIFTAYQREGISINCFLFFFFSDGQLFCLFVHLIGRSLKHVKSGRCIHTSGAWPGNGRQMVLWSGCDVQRLQLWFGKQGKLSCHIPHLLSISCRKSGGHVVNATVFIEKVLFQTLGGPSFAVWERHWPLLAP